MRTTTIQVRPSPIGWQVCIDGISQPYAQFPRKADARRAAEEMADAHRPARVRVHRVDGSIESELRYAERPRKPVVSARAPSAWVMIDRVRFWAR